MYVDERYAPRLQVMSRDIMMGRPPFEGCIPARVEEVLAEQAALAEVPLERLRERYFFGQHRFFEVLEDPDIPPSLPLMNWLGTVLFMVQDGSPLIGGQPAWKPKARELRPCFERAAEEMGLVLEAEKDGSNFNVVFAPRDDLGLRVHVYTILRGDTYMDPLLAFPNTAWRTDLKKLFGDVRNPILWQPEDAEWWSLELARYAKAVFTWWAQPQREAEAGPHT